MQILLLLAALASLRFSAESLSQRIAVDRCRRRCARRLVAEFAREYLRSTCDLISPLFVDHTAKILAAHESEQIVREQGVMALPQFFRECGDVRRDQAIIERP